MITKYCLKAKFAGIDNELFFEVDEKEFSRLKERYLEVSRPEEAISFKMSDGSAAIIACKSIETLHFVFESSLEEFPPSRASRTPIASSSTACSGARTPNTWPSTRLPPRWNSTIGSARPWKRISPRMPVSFSP